MRQIAERLKRQTVAHNVFHNRFAVFARLEFVQVNPLPVRAFERRVNKIARRIPPGNFGFPFDRKSAQF